MNTYAQTNIQLYNQLCELGYADADLERIHRAYGLAMTLFTGAFRGSGRPFLAHLIGIASVLAWLRAPIAVVEAGLLHSVYSHGEFGNSWRGMTEGKRDRVRAVVGGDEVEELVADYTRFRWTAETIGVLAQTVESLGERERWIVLMRLANEVDDHRDLGLLYVAEVERRREFIWAALHRCVALAERLGYPALATELSQVLKETLSAEVSSALRGPKDDSFLLAPASHTWRPGVVARRVLARLLRG